MTDRHAVFPVIYTIPVMRGNNNEYTTLPLLR